MTPFASERGRIARLCKNLALFCLFTGFALELGGGITDHRGLLRIGLFLFLAGLPLFLVGWLLGRSKL